MYNAHPITIDFNDTRIISVAVLQILYDFRVSAEILDPIIIKTNGMPYSSMIETRRYSRHGVDNIINYL